MRSFSCCKYKEKEESKSKNRDRFSPCHDLKSYKIECVNAFTYNIIVNLLRM